MSDVPPMFVVLGQVGVAEADQVVAATSPTVATVLGALAVAGADGLSGDQLAAAIWGAAPASKSALSVALHRSRAWLQATAGDTLRVDFHGQRYRLTGPVDLARFHTLVQAAADLAPAERIEPLTAALA